MPTLKSKLNATKNYPPNTKMITSENYTDSCRGQTDSNRTSFKLNV